MVGETRIARKTFNFLSPLFRVWYKVCKNRERSFLVRTLMRNLKDTTKKRKIMYSFILSSANNAELNSR